MVNKKETKEVPVFIAPKKRQSTKKINGASQKNYVDHIVPTQVGSKIILTNNK